MINGVSVPVTNGLSAATTLVQSGNLSIGSEGSGTANTYFDGYISEPRVWSVAQSQASIQANMAINLTTATNLVFSMTPGTFNDASGNGNNLTPTNSPTATQATNPYNATEYGFVTAITSSQITVFTGTNCTIPNQILGAVTYSRDRSPYGFPVARTNWIVDALYANAVVQNTPGNGTFYNIASAQLAVPIGAWRLAWEASMTINSTSGGLSRQQGGLSTSTSSFSEPRLVAFYGVPGASQTMSNTLRRELLISQSSDTTWYLVEAEFDGNGNAIYLDGSTSHMAVIFAECAYA